MEKKNEESKKNSLLPSLCVIIPTQNSAHLLPATLDSLADQGYPGLRILLIDAGSTDQIFNLLDSYPQLIWQLYPFPSNKSLYERLNRGISLAAEEEYVTFFHPGDQCLTTRSFHEMAHFLIETHQPDLLYAGCLLNEVDQGSHAPFVPFNHQELSRGSQPANLAACWFRVKSLIHLGKFDTTYMSRGAYELFCRYFKQDSLKTVLFKKVTVMHYLARRSPKINLRYALETYHIIKKYFGLRDALRWWIGQNHLQFIRNWLTYIKYIFIKKDL